MRARRERRRTSGKQRKVTVTESRWTNKVGKRERERGSDGGNDNRENCKDRIRAARLRVQRDVNQVDSTGTSGHK